MEVFAVKGYHGTVVDDIVAGSRTSKGAFYHYFSSKQAIFLVLLDELAATVEQAVEAVIASEHGALAKVDAALRVVMETAADRRDLVRILLIEAVGLGPTLEQTRLEIHQRFAHVIQRHLDRARADGDIPPQDTALAAQAWIGALNEVITQWLVSNTGDLMSRLPTVRTLLLQSIGAKA
jgi:AcrR family transcriptional regulator